MRKQLIISLLVIFAVSVFAPVVSMAFNSDVVIVNVDDKEKFKRTF